MSRKRTVRRVYALLNPIAHAMQGAAITSRAECDRLLARELAALDDLTHGRGTVQQWHDMVTVMNLCETLALSGVGPEAFESIRKAEEGLIEAGKRFHKTQKMGLSGQTIQALRDVIEFHDLQRSSISRREYEVAIARMRSNIVNRVNVIDIDDLIQQEAA